MRPRLRACPEAWQALRASFMPPLPRRLLPLRLVVPPLNVLAFGTLPRWARQLYGTPGLLATDAAVTAALRAVHESTNLIPERLLFIPEAAAAARQQRRAA
jgi:hypothetical protein